MGELTITLNRISPVPLYHQLSRQLVEAIESGRLPKGSFLDSEIDLAERWQVSRPTVRRAIQDLVDSGLLVRRRGVGTQVVSDQVRRPFKLTSDERLRARDDTRSRCHTGGRAPAGRRADPGGRTDACDRPQADSPGAAKAPPNTDYRSRSRLAGHAPNSRAIC